MPERDSQIEWVFFDVGSVLFNDDPQNYLAYRLLHEEIRKRHPDYTFEDMLAEREEHARDGANWILLAIARRMLPDLDAKQFFEGIREHLIPAYDANHLLSPHVFEVLRELHGKVRLGIIANQPAECRESLRRREMLDFFEVVAISEELDLHKPDVRIFEWAIDAAKCDPTTAVMIGDRRDNDIAPARSLSMRTVLVAWPHSAGRNWQPEDPYAHAYLRSCDRVPLFRPREQITEPDRIVSSLAEIPAAIDSLRAAP